METKNSKELENIMEAINKWVEKHKGDVQFHGSFMAFDENDDYNMIDSRIIAYGPKKSILMSSKELKKIIKKEKEKDGFINF